MPTYRIEQFPKNKDIHPSRLNEYQIILRGNQKSYKYKATKVCTKCSKSLPLKEFYIKNKNTKRRSNSCRDCQMKQQGTIEIGKQRFADKILKKGFRRCSVCKDIKPLTEFCKNKGQYKGISNNCYSCSYKLHKKFQVNQRAVIGKFYIRQYAKRVHGIEVNADDEYAKYRAEIETSREPKFFLDGLEFIILEDFAKYIEKRYGIKKAAVIKRVAENYTEQECILPEQQIRSMKSGTTKGRIKVVDTITGDIWHFNNTKDNGLNNILSGWAVLKGIRTGLPVGGCTNSKHKNPCLVERII